MQRPIALGADLVVHSTTKYLNGHSDSVGGVVVAARAEDVEWLKFIQNAAGAILSPFDSWLVLRGTKTLTVRMAQHNANGLALAGSWTEHPKVAPVLYPGLPSHPQHELAKRQMRGFGGMLSFDVGDFEAARRVCNRVRLMSLAESLGGVETLICHPGDDDARLGACRAAAGDRPDRQPGPHLGRHRRSRRPDRGSGAGARLTARSVSARRGRLSARQCRRSSTIIGSSDTKTIPMVTSEKLFFTIGTLPKRKPAPTQSTTHAAAPTKL